MDRYIEHEDRLLNMYKFMKVIVIEGGCGYDLKQVSFKIMHGILTFDEAVKEWSKLGWYTFKYE